MEKITQAKKRGMDDSGEGIKIDAKRMRVVEGTVQDRDKADVLEHITRDYRISGF